MKDQLLRIMESEAMTPAKFADEIGVQRSSISHILSGRNKPSYDFIIKILNRFSGINAEWLITGKGSMIKSIETVISKEMKQTSLFDQNGNNLLNLTKKTEANIDNYILPAAPQNENKDSNNNTMSDKKGDSYKKNEITNVNKANLVLLFYEDGTYDRFIPRQ
jgi:transcriptional regulator with XRE-family HTH domain